MRITVTVPDGQVGDWKVETFTISEAEARFANIRAVFKGPLEAAMPGTFKRLVHGSDIVMTNTPMEARTNRPIIRAAAGLVLLNGLGLGMVLGEILKKKQVTDVWVVEKHKEVIDLVGPSFHQKSAKIIHEAAFEFKTSARFNAVWP